MTIINWGIIGLGDIAKKFAKGFSSSNNSSLKAIASKKKENLKLFKKKFEIENQFCFENYDDLILSKDVDIIYIALPNSFHAEITIKALKNFKNVLVEKPAVTNTKDLNLIKDLVLKNNVYFTESFMYRHLPYFSYLKDIINENNLGNLLKVDSHFCEKLYKQKNFFGFKIYKPDYSNRLFNKDLGGGSILDLGCYPISLISFLNSITHNVKISDIKFQKVKKEFCESGVDIYSEIELNLNNKFISKIKCSFKDNHDQSTKIYFENGLISIRDTWTPKQNMTINLQLNKKMDLLEFKNDKNFYSHQIENISKQLINKKNKPTFPAISIEEIDFNTELLEQWIKLN